MPLFDFKCAKCSLIFEELVATTEQTATCPSCQQSAPRANAVEQVAKPVVKGSSVDGTGRAYIQDGDYMVGLKAAAAWEKMDQRDNYKRNVMHKNNTTALARYDIVEVEKSYTGKERKIEHTEYEPLKGEALESFISGHKHAQQIAKAGGLKNTEIPITKDMKKIDV